eukprot:6528770-Pyramimonas_sp.AAC.1
MCIRDSRQSDPRRLLRAEAKRTRIPPYATPPLYRQHQPLYAPRRTPPTARACAHTVLRRRPPVPSTPTPLRSTP